MDITKYNADDARRKAANHRSSDLMEILTAVDKKAEQGETKLHWYHQLSDKEINILKERGFSVREYGSVPIQKDGLYVTISWD